MSFSIAIVREITPDENRVALVPESVKKLTDKGFKVYLKKELVRMHAILIHLTENQVQKS